MRSPSPPYLKLILSAKQVQENARNTKTMVYMLFLKSRKLFAKIKLDIGRLNTREHNDRIVSNVPAVVYDTLINVQRVSFIKSIAVQNRIGIRRPVTFNQFSLF